MDRIVITGPKSSGKSNIGARLAELLGLTFYDLDDVLETIFEEQEGIHLTFREIYRRHGEEAFRKLEHKAAFKVAQLKGTLLSTGGTTFTIPSLRDIVVADAYVILLTNTPQVLWERTTRKGRPSYLEKSRDPQADFFRRVSSVVEAVTPVADLYLDTEELSIEEVAQLLDVELQRRNINFG